MRPNGDGDAFGALALEDALAHGFQTNPLLGQHAKSIRQTLSNLTKDMIIVHYDHKVANLAAMHAANSSAAGGVAISNMGGKVPDSCGNCL
jgi:hypothetical protein